MARVELEQQLRVTMLSSAEIRSVWKNLFALKNTHLRVTFKLPNHFNMLHIDNMFQLVAQSKGYLQRTFLLQARNVCT